MPLHLHTAYICFPVSAAELSSTETGWLTNKYLSRPLQKSLLSHSQKEHPHHDLNEPKEQEITTTNVLEPE